MFLQYCMLVSMLFREGADGNDRIFDNRDMGHSTLPTNLQNEPYDVQDMANDVIELVKVGVEDLRNRE